MYHQNVEFQGFKKFCLPNLPAKWQVKFSNCFKLDIFPLLMLYLHKKWQAKFLKPSENAHSVEILSMFIYMFIYILGSTINFSSFPYYNATITRRILEATFILCF